MAFIGIKIPGEVSRLLSNIKVPGEKTDIDEFHITILHFEDDFSISDIAKSLETAHPVIQKIKPFEIELNQISCFPKREDNPVPIISLIKSKELQNLYKDLAKAFDENKIEFSKTFKNYNPHVTLSYADDEIKNFDMNPIKFQVSSLGIWGGNEGTNRNSVYINFPFNNHDKHAMLATKVELLYKLALV